MKQNRTITFFRILITTKPVKLMSRTRTNSINPNRVLHVWFKVCNKLKKKNLISLEMYGYKKECTI